jgi:hypothetical protein
LTACSEQIIETEQKAKPKRLGPINDAALIYIPAIILITTLAIALNIHYLVSTFAVTFQVAPSSILQTILNSLDVFLKPTSIGSLRFSIEIIPLMVAYVVLSGIPPAIVLPYLRKFKITGTQPHYYSYLLPAITGLSLHYSLGAFIGREKAEMTVENILKTKSLRRVYQGKMTVQKQPPISEPKPT